VRAGRAAALLLAFLAARPLAGQSPGGPASEEKGVLRPANHLAREKSPYLLQHAHNPVDWYPWGEEPFRKARAEAKPVFLSIGYSTCHWCHVMERESFENEEIARILNESFVAIKVDREERPDVDQVYLSAVQALFGQGGWPLSVFLTPEGKPFFGGTYFPPEDDPARGRGFRPLLLLVAKSWKDERKRIAEGSELMVERLAAHFAGVGASAPAAAPSGSERAGGSPLSPALLLMGYQAFQGLYDSGHGGFGAAPKFPRTSVLDFLLALGSRPGAPEARSMALSTLDAMARGGIRDHLAGGFHRYSTDRTWTVPHFEKMLYDQALIGRTYFDAGRLTGDAKYLQVGREALDYLLARSLHPEGGFFSAEDADSEGAEGKCYVWSRDEVVSLLGEAEGKLLSDYFGVTAEGNFEESRRSVLTLPYGPEEFARRAGLEPRELSERLAEGRARLLEARNRRIQPLRDDKVLTDWNGLTISALAIGYQATGEARYLAAAGRAADFVGKRMVAGGRLLHRFREGEAAIPGFLEDHAFLVAGLLDLYEAGLELPRLREAIRLAREMVKLFWDPKSGGFFQTGPDHPALILRKKEFYDGALPSGNAVAYLDLLRLSELTEEPEFRAKAAALEGLWPSLLAEGPTEHPKLLLALAYRLAPPRQIALAGAAGDPRLKEMVREVQRRYLPAKVLALLEPGSAAEARALLPFLAGKEPLEGKPTGYVCRGGTCKLPAKDLAALKKELED
jgi:uncharacterized protein YyaL (SSP411 family)